MELHSHQKFGIPAVEIAFCILQIQVSLDSEQLLFCFYNPVRAFDLIQIKPVSFFGYDIYFCYRTLGVFDRNIYGYRIIVIFNLIAQLHDIPIVFGQLNVFHQANKTFARLIFIIFDLRLHQFFFALMQRSGVPVSCHCVGPASGFSAFAYH